MAVSEVGGVMQDETPCMRHGVGPVAISTIVERDGAAVRVGARTQRVCIVGAGTRFLSGISYYTLRLSNALASSHRVSVILMRQLLPTRFYPGRARVGSSLTQLQYASSTRVFDGLDWYWLPSLFRALAFVRAEKPQVMVLQWWSATVLHSHFALALVARLLKCRVLVEFHEVLDPGEAELFLARIYVALVSRLVVSLAHGFVIHSESDRATLQKHYGLGQRVVEVIAHGPYDQYELQNGGQIRRDAPVSSCNILFFGLIRPYKGLEDLIRVFDSLSEAEIEGYWLTIVGETWENWTLPAELIVRSRYRNRITFVNQYVADPDVTGFFAGADIAVFPYHRSSGSGSLHIAMSLGLPVVVTDVGGLQESVARYDGAIVVPPRDATALRRGLTRAAGMRGRRFADPNSWEQTVERYESLFRAVA